MPIVLQQVGVPQASVDQQTKQFSVTISLTPMPTNLAFQPS